MDDTVGWQPLLRGALAALASGPDQQVRAHGPGCIGCDLLNDFDDAWQVALGNPPLSADQCSALARLDVAINGLSPPDLECFNNDVVRRPAWQPLRELAGHALREFGWPDATVREFREISPGVWHRPSSDADLRAAGEPDRHGRFLVESWVVLGDRVR